MNTYNPSVAFLQAQMRSLQRFMGGECNALVATSVAEEGLDLPACQLVVQHSGCSQAVVREHPGFNFAYVIPAPLRDVESCVVAILIMLECALKEAENVGFCTRE